MGTAGEHTADTEPAPPERPADRRRAGRPRRLTTEQVIEAAIALGLDDLTMARLAESLGVRVAVLYNYVRNREELVSLAARSAMSRQRFPDDEAQDWRSYARAYARAAHGLFLSDAQLLPLLVAGKISPAAKLDSVEGWLRVMTANGFAPAQAVQLLRAIDAIVMGSAVLASHAQAHATDYPQAVRDTIEARGRRDLPLLNAHAADFVRSTDPANWATTLDLLLDNIAPRRRPPATSRE